MQDQNRFALKEWAVIAEALSRGRQIFILRKGGLIEGRGRFAMEHREFFIYPTRLHQQRRGVVPEALPHLERLDQMAAIPDRIVLTHYAAATAVYPVRDPAILRRLEGRHWLNREEVEKRFHFGGTPGLTLVVLRLYRLPAPHRLPILPRYAGCRSWVDLGCDLSTARAAPVIGEAAFAAESKEISEQFGGGRDSAEAAHECP